MKNANLRCFLQEPAKWRREESTGLAYRTKKRIKIKLRAEVFRVPLH
jgi:hypothetical protein